MSNKANPFLIDKNSDERKGNDYYPTPPIATEALIHHYKEIIPDNIWEPCCGRGWMSKVLLEAGYSVKSSDLFKYENLLIPNAEWYKDFLTEEFPNDIEGIITNPPYMKNFTEKLIEKSLKHVKFVAVLQRLFFLESAKRYELFCQTRPDVLVFSGRVNFQEEFYNQREKQMGGMMAFAWFIWHENCNGNIEWVNPKFTFTDKTLEDFSHE
jgi:hypothetical protein